MLLVYPTWRMARRVVVPSMERVFNEFGIHFTLNKTDLTYRFLDREIWVASGDKPESLVGVDVVCVGVDEPAIMDEDIDRRATPRARDPRAIVSQVLYTGTHEGLGWFFRRTADMPTITVSTRANTHLTSVAIDRMLDMFKDDPVRMAMYFNGAAMALSGGIYTCFTDKNLRRCENPKQGEIVLGMDFNVGFMCTPIARVIGDEVHVVGEVISRNTRTEAHVERIVEWLRTRGLATVRQGQFGVEVCGPNGRRIDAWLDATSTARKTSATRTDRDIVKAAGFFPRHPSSNPAVRDRIEVVQHALSHSRLFIDPDGAPFCCRSLKEHAYAPRTDPPRPAPHREGEDAFDSANDGIGYLTCGIVGVSRSVFRVA